MTPHHKQWLPIFRSARILACRWGGHPCPPRALDLRNESQTTRATANFCSRHREVADTDESAYRSPRPVPRLRERDDSSKRIIARAFHAAEGSVSKRLWRAAWAALLLGSILASRAQVHSLTLGIDVNSPYGLSEPWVMIREGLQRLEFVEAVSPQPDREAFTGEMRPRDGRIPDLILLTKALRDIGAGASLRGVEATVEGDLAKDGDAFLLRLPGSEAALRLKPLRSVVQRHRQATPSEKAAFETLVAHWKDRPLRAMVIGPLRQTNDAPGAIPDRFLWLEVRTFTFKP